MSFAIAVRLAAVMLLLPTAVALAQSDTTWDKTYPVSASPALWLETGDSSLNVHPCSGCRAVHIHVAAEGTKLSLYTLTESQSGNTIHFSLKQKPNLGFHINWRGSQRVQVDVETPAEVTLNARTGDGSLGVNGVHGAITLESSDGTQSVADVSGDLKLHGSDGAVSVQHSSGTLEARTSDGSLSVSGAFTALQLRSSDGAVRVELAEGSRLSAPSSIQASDGGISVRLPQTFPAELDIHASDGSIRSTLPLTLDGFVSGSGHNLHGKLDGGGAPLTIHTSDGMISLSRL